MNDIKWYIGVALCCVMMVSGCVRNQFDQQRYEEIVEEESPTPKVDEDHDWMMSTTFWRGKCEARTDFYG